MTEKPILFSAPMVRAILEGRKTQTRRIIKPQPFTSKKEEVELWREMKRSFGNDVSLSDCLNKAWHAGFVDVRCPYAERTVLGVSGRLWVRETWQSFRGQSEAEQAKAAEILQRFQAGKVTDIVAEATAMSTVGRSGDIQYLYAADFGDWAFNPDSDLKPWRPSIYMPRAASRITLEITDVKVERLQDISAKDAEAEGIQVPVSAETKRPLLCITSRVDSHKLWADNKNATLDDYFIGYFALLWEEINGKGSWGANPWCWAVSFRRVQ